MRLAWWWNKLENGERDKNETKNKKTKTMKHIESYLHKNNTFKSLETGFTPGFIRIWHWIESDERKKNERIYVAQIMDTQATIHQVFDFPSFVIVVSFWLFVNIYFHSSSYIIHISFTPSITNEK